MLRLDINLVFTIINLLVLYLLMKKFLFKPVNGIIKQREEAIKKQFEEAEEARKQADDYKMEYAIHLENAKADATRLVQEAKEKARTEYDRIVSAADEEAANRLQKAKQQIAEEKAKSLRSMENEIEDLVMAAATKVVGEKVSVESNHKFYDDFITEMGEKQ